MLYWISCFSVTQTLNWNYIHFSTFITLLVITRLYRPVTYILWSSDFPYILKTIWWKNVIIGILDPCYTKINVGQWPTFRGPVILTYILKTFWLRNVGLKILISVTLSLTYKYIHRSVTYILWYSDSVLYFKYYLMNWILVLIWGIDLYFMIRWFWIISANSDVLKFDMKIFVNVARLEIDQLFTQGARLGHPYTLDTFLVFF